MSKAWARFLGVRGKFSLSQNRYFSLLNSQSKLPIEVVTAGGPRVAWAVRNPPSVSGKKPLMLRVLVLIAAVLFFRAFLPRKSKRSPTEVSPYMNSLDGLLSEEQLSQSSAEVRLRELQMAQSAVVRSSPSLP
jgi:hypothetical protein